MSLSPEYMRPEHADSPVRLAKCWWRKARYNRLLMISSHTRSDCKMPCSKDCFPMTIRIQLSEKEKKKEKKRGKESVDTAGRALISRAFQFLWTRFDFRAIEYLALDTGDSQHPEQVATSLAVSSRSSARTCAIFARSLLSPHRRSYLETYKISLIARWSRHEIY
jgi:hypothetical protein